VEDVVIPSFGETLARFRTQAKLSQKRLADLVGKTRRAVAGWEGGDYLPEASVVLQLARILDLDNEETTLLLKAAGRDPSPPLWHVPYHRNPYFTGRDELLNKLDQYLAPPEQAAPLENRRVALTQPHAITGLGGIGKTQIAVEYAYRSRASGRYTHTFWVNAASKETILASFVEIAELLLSFAARNETDQRKLVEAVKHWLEQCKQPWLLIFDNVDHDDDLPIIREYLPQRGNGSVLLTTRASAVGSLATSIEVETMGFVEGTHLLLRRAQRFEHPSDEETNQAGNIVVALDHFPLALDQAGAYIEETRYSFEEYLNLYQTHRQKLLAKRGKLATDYPDSVATTWSLSFQKVQQANPAAAELLHLCAFLTPDRIPEELIKDGAAYWPSLLQQAAADRFAFNQMIEELLKYSLVKRLVEDRTLSIHRLLQAIQRDRMEQETQRQWAERVVLAVNRVFPDDPREPAAWPRCLRYLDQAQACHELIEHYRFVFVEAASILNRAGLYLQDHALYAEAEPLYLRALAIREQHLGSEHPLTAISLNNLAELYRVQGKYEQAEPLYQRTLTIDYGAKRSAIITDFNNLASLYFVQRRYSEAEPLYQRALTIREQQSGAEHPDTATSLNNLATLYRVQGKYEQAEPLYQRALAIYEKRVGSAHPSTATSLNNLASLYQEQGKYKQAEPLYQRALAIREQQLGAEHPDTATSFNNLASLYFVQCRYSEAEPLLKHALTIYERQLGAEHPTTRTIQANYIALLEAMKSEGEADS
jgi:tetratricopeptide (TPR) repeat protein